MHENLSQTVTAFLAEVEQVCRRHGFALAPSAYDSLEVWPLQPGDEPLQFPGIEEK